MNKVDIQRKLKSDFEENIQWCRSGPMPMQKDTKLCKRVESKNISFKSKCVALLRIEIKTERATLSIFVFHDTD
jgi:hypothetical protein